jgi:hypothetical protein
MAAYAEDFNVLRHANVGLKKGEVDGATTPMRHPDLYRYDIDVSQAAEAWRRGGEIGPWLLDLTASALCQDSCLNKFTGRVSDSGDGRWTLEAAIDEGVPAPVLSAALFQRFGSRGATEYADKSCRRCDSNSAATTRSRRGRRMDSSDSDALVFFGATGDLAHKQNFPALMGLVRDEGLNVPIVGVANAGWTLDQWKARAKDSLKRHGSYDEAGFAKLAALCSAWSSRRSPRAASIGTRDWWSRNRSDTISSRPAR